MLDVEELRTHFTAAEVLYSYSLSFQVDSFRFAKARDGTWRVEPDWAITYGAIADSEDLLEQMLTPAM
jgi:hypothetical protein